MQVNVAMLVLFLATLLFIVALLFFRNGKQHADHKIPPGNLSLPLIGETFSFAKPHPSTTLGPFMQNHISRFGKIFTANLMGGSTIVSVDAELNRFVWRNETRLFVLGWPRNLFTIFGKRTPTLAVGDAHKYIRSKVLSFLSSARVRTVFMEDANCVASELISSWKEGVVISAKNEAAKFSFYVIAKKTLSMTPNDPEFNRLHKEFQSILKGISSFPLNVPGTTYWRALQSRKNILEIFKQVMGRRNAMMTDEDRGLDNNDFLGWLMKNTHYSVEEIGDFLLGVLFAGHDATSRAITALIYFLEGCPSAIKQLREEHLQVACKRQKLNNSLTWDEYDSLEFTKCVINETLRLGTFSIALRKATEDIKFNEYLIPKDFKVMLHFKAMHLDPSIYEDPESFNPWRWLSPSCTKQNENFMPFGSGARLCPGAELARLEMSIFLHHLILKYDWELAVPDSPMDIPYVEFPKGLPIKLHAI